MSAAGAARLRRLRSCEFVFIPVKLNMTVLPKFFWSVPGTVDQLKLPEKSL